MKSNLFVAVFCLLIIPPAVSAQNFDTFGELSKSEIEMKQCSFDPEADAVVLLHEAFSVYDESYHLVTTHHVRIKILKEKGIANADISIPFWRRNDFEQILVTKAVTINISPEGQLSQLNLERKSFFTKKTNEFYGEMVFTFPNVKTGSVMEYEYVSTMKHYGGLEEWDFQEELPVVASKYNLTIVPNAEFAYRFNKRDDLQAVAKPFSGGIYFEMDNIPGLRNEPYMDARKDYLQKVIFQLSGFNNSDGFGGHKYMTSWDEVTRELITTSEFGGIIGKNIAGTDEFIKQVKLIPQEPERMKKVFDFVRHNMSWNHIYSKYANDGIKDAWQKKTGTSGQINFILINLLKEAGLEVYPTLISQRSHGKVSPNYPFVDQFSSVIACAKVNGRNYYLDATDKFTPAHIIPDDLLNTTAFVVNRKNGGLVNISNDSLMFAESINTEIDVASNGEIKANTTIISSNYASVDKRQEYLSVPNKFADRHFSSEKMAIRISKFDVSNLDNDSLPFVQTCDFVSQLSNSGDYNFIPLNLFSGFTNNPFISDNRFSNINFGYKRLISIITRINLPDGFAVEQLPKSVRLTDPDKDFEFVRSIEYSQESKSITSGIKIQFHKSLYEADLYPVLKEVYIRLFDYLNEPILLKKK